MSHETRYPESNEHELEERRKLEKDGTNNGQSDEGINMYSEKVMSLEEFRAMEQAKFSSAAKNRTSTKCTNEFNSDLQMEDFHFE